MKSILITIDGNENDVESLNFAKALAAPTGARLTVLHPKQAPSSIYALADAVFASNDAEAAARSAEAARGAFDTVLAHERAAFGEFEGDASAAIAAVGFAHDLIMVERLSAEEGPQAAQLNAALFDSGRPVIAIPPHAADTAPKHVAIAWNGQAQAARAMRSALPLLQQAEAATLLLGSGNRGVSAQLVAAYLEDYGVKPFVMTYDSERLTARARGRALLAAVEEAGADCLVAGAYGEGGRSDIGGLGRATQKVVTAAAVPVLLQS